MDTPQCRSTVILVGESVPGTLWRGSRSLGKTLVQDDKQPPALKFLNLFTSCSTYFRCLSRFLKTVLLSFMSYAFKKVESAPHWTSPWKWKRVLRRACAVYIKAFLQPCTKTFLSWGPFPQGEPEWGLPWGLWAGRSILTKGVGFLIRKGTPDSPRPPLPGGHTRLAGAHLCLHGNTLRRGCRQKRSFSKCLSSP